MIFWQLFLEFFKVGLFSFGGALASVPFLQEMAERTGWFTSRQLADIIAISQSAPGPIGVNMATNVGYIVAGVNGGIVATLGIITPSIIIMMIVARILSKLSKNTLIQSAFCGLRAASVGLIAAAGTEIIKISLLFTDAWKATGDLMQLFNWKALIFAIVLFLFIDRFKVHPIFYLAFSMVIGIIFRF